ncbi:hypothetical protein JCM17846_18820 [Iodidimonas nitroreducens]|uniref:Lipoprotein n=1 Tax=Iodidimonas nitroreducens TaxID=1236968 RepID=A0A5A7N9S3_9PROT|nr:PD40 domain-containing protein [Iodidimonas nitroreducens]GER04200.1 hypothetical protein JCM17846_18820 [Iodidimonas nitroreducens]
MSSWLKSLSFLIFATAACGESSVPDRAASSDENQAPAHYDAAAFLESDTYLLGHAGGHAFSPDGSRILVNSDRSGVFKAYALGPEAEQFESFGGDALNSLYGVSWFPAGPRILLTGDRGGNKHNSVFVREPDGSLIDLTPPGDYEVAGQESGLRFLGWRNDGTAFYLTSTERDPEVADLYVYDATSYERKMLFKNSRELPFPTRGFKLSPDGRWLSLDFHHTRYDFDLYLVDLESADREPRLILTSEGREVIHTGYGFTPDSQKLIYGTDATGEFLEARTYDIASAETAPLVEADWDVVDVAFSADGRYRLATINVDAKFETRIFDTEQDRLIDLSFMPEGRSAIHVLPKVAGWR